MSNALTCVALLTAAALTAGTAFADSPPSEEQIQAKLKEARQRVEAAQAEERALQKQLADAQKRPHGQITAEVEGVLCFQDGIGYYIRVRSKASTEVETRVWLIFGEDKVTGKILAELQGDDVVANGSLHQAGAGRRIPEGGLFLTDFSKSIKRGPVIK
jgi:hypothetical protein